MSKSRQPRKRDSTTRRSPASARTPADDHIFIRSFGVTYPYGRNVLPHQSVPPRALDWHKLIYAIRGVVTVRANESAWIAPPHRGIWIPAHLDFHVEMHGTVALRALYFKPGRRFLAGPVRSSAPAPSPPFCAMKSCCVMNVRPLLRELIQRTVQIGALDMQIRPHARLAAVILDELRALVAQPLQLPAPRDPRAQKFAEIAAAERIPVSQMLRKSAASRRTMERLFREETGMSMGQWLRRQKLLDALRRLAAGDSVNSIAFDLGYNSASAFIAMFRRELGQTPAKYFES